MPHSRKFNLVGFISSIGFALGTSFLISLEDNVVTNMEILRACLSALVAAFAFLQARYVVIVPPSIAPKEETEKREPKP